MTYFYQNLQAAAITLRRLQVYTILLFFIASPPILFGDVYRVKKGDTLLIAVIGQPEYTYSVEVRRDGMISYFGGDLKVAGQTVAEVNQQIRDFLVQEKLVNNPIVMVSPVLQENSIYVGGAVKTPGRYAISPETDIGLYRAIALAGGIAENADTQQVQLIRFGDGSGQNRLNTPTDSTSQVKVTTYNLSTNRPYRDVRVNVKDLVFVMPLSVVEVQGQVQVPGKLFIRGKISISDALARAGGVTEAGDLTALVKVNRDGTLSEFSVTEQFWKTTDANGTDISLSDGDVLFVPNAFKVEPIYVTGYVRTPGAQRVRGPLTLAKAIALAGGFEDAANRKEVRIYRRDGTSTKHPFTDNKAGGSILLYPGDIVEVDKRFQINWGLVSTIASTTIGLTYLIINLTSN